MSEPRVPFAEPWAAELDVPANALAPPEEQAPPPEPPDQRDGERRLAAVADGPTETTGDFDGRLVDGASFVLDAPADVPAVWGDREMVAWAEGEPLYLVGPAGAGKTTAAQRLILARCGLVDGLLGLPVADDGRRVLYIAADRPRQAQRSMARMVGEDERRTLADRLVVWRGPLPFDLAIEPSRLTAMAQHFGAGTIVIDSLKDVALDLTDDATGARVNNALQQAISAGIQVVVLHHQRKPSNDNRKPRALADVYGSTWLTAGAGSVVLLWGDAGDPIVELTHPKPPAEDIGPITVLHDQPTGALSVADQTDPLTVLRAAPKGVRPRDLACQLTGKADPDRNAVEKARRRLEKLVDRGLAYRWGGAKGGEQGGSPTVYVATDDRREDPR